MRLVISNTNVEIKYKKVSVNQLVPQPVVEMRSPDGKKVKSVREASNGQILEGFHWKYRTEDGEDIPKKDIQYFQLKEDGSEAQVRPFERTKEIKIVKEVPITSVNDMLFESTYELFHKDESIIRALYNEALRFLENDLAGICLFSWGKY